MYNLPAGKFVRHTNLDSQAFENYFYGETMEVEKELAKLEAEVSTILSNIKKYKDIPQRTSEDYINLMFFIFIQILRTKYMAEEADESANKLFHKIFSHDEKLKSKLDNLTLYNEKPSLFVLSTMAKQFPIPILLDLKCKLIINQTEDFFITSDNPVVRYNQFLLRRKWPLGKTGLAQRGLQILFPIGAKKLLILYDNQIYFVGHNKRDVVYLKKKQDIYGINSLQYLNSLENLYFNGNVSEYYIENLVDANVKYKNLEKSSVTELPATKREPDNRYSSLIILQSKEISKDINLSFINERKYAKEYVLGPSAAVVRNEQILKYLENLNKKKVDLSPNKRKGFY